MNPIENPYSPPAPDPSSRPLVVNWLGLALGLILGRWLGDIVGGYFWTTTKGSDGAVVAVGIPVGQIIGSGVGLLFGAIAGAFVDRIVRGPTAAPDRPVLARWWLLTGSRLR